MSEQKVGRYELKGEVGRGGMGTVYRAFDPLTRREVALKLLPREFLHNPTFRARFEHEAHSIASLEHPAIVPVYDYGEEDGQPFLVMRLMPGGSLSDRVKQGPMSMADIARIIGQIAPGLDQAHAQGMIHRDLKPANILFDGYTNPHISDFGLVKLAEDTSGLTSSGIVGTPKYMAPEMTNPKGVTRLVDIYALGVTVYEMATGESPFKGDTPIAILMAHLNAPVPRLRDVQPDLPEYLQIILDRAMAKDPAQRYQSAAALAADLEQLIAAEKTGRIPDLSFATSPSMPVPRQRKSGGIPVWILAGAGGMVIVIGLGLGLVFGGALGGAKPIDTPTELPTQQVAAVTDAPTEAPAETSAPATEAPTETVTQAATEPPASAVTRKIVATNLREMTPLRTLSGDIAVLQDVEWSHDGAMLATTMGDKVMLWNPQTGDKLAEFRGEDKTHSVAFSPDGTRLATTWSNRLAITLDTLTGNPVGNPFRAPNNYGFSDASWSPDGNLIALAPDYTSVFVWDLRTDSVAYELKRHFNRITSVAFSPDGSLLASSDRDGKIHLWNVSTGEFVASMVDHFDGLVNQIAWSPNGNYLAAATFNKEVVIYDVSTTRVILRLGAVHTDVVNSVAWSPDGSLIASGGLDRSIVIWDTSNGLKLFQRDTVDINPRIVQRLAFSPDQTMLAVGLESGETTVWGFGQ